MSGLGQGGYLPTGNLWAAFRRSLLLNADRPALLFADVSWSYRQFGHAVAEIAARLAAAGVRPGSRVLLMLANSPLFPAADVALMALGAAKTPLSTMLSRAEVEAAVNRIRPTCILTDPSTRRLAAECAGTGIVELPDDPGDLVPAAAVGDQRLPEPHDLPPEAVAAVYLSGGTTGVPKGIVHSQQSVLANLWAHLLDAGIHRDDRLLLTTPLAHSAGLFTLAALLRGACVRIDPVFDAESVLRRIDADAITWIYGVPTMLHRLVEAAERLGWRPSTLRTVQYGSAPISAGLLARALRLFGPVLQQLYAQTECPQYATLLSKDDHIRALTEPRLLSSAGRPSLMCEVSIRGDDGMELAVERPGEVCLRAPYVMSGYWEAEAGHERFHGTWLRTGDVGYLDEEGYLFLLDRRGDMIISGGLNVYSVEVEDALSRHPDVGESAVIGVPHEEWGEAVHAVVVLRTGADPRAAVAALEAYCRAELAAYKRPKAYQVVHELPLTRFGKTDKKALRAPYWKGSSRAIH